MTVKKARFIAEATCVFFLAPLVLQIACTPKVLVTFPLQTYLGEMKDTLSNCMVTLRAARNNAMGSLLVVNNTGATPVSITPEGVTLTIADSLTVLAVDHFTDYVYRRIISSKKACDAVSDCISCRNTVTRYFVPFLNVQKRFMFGILGPKSSREGAIGFDLLDPDNTSDRAKKIVSMLQNRPERTVSVVVRVVIKSEHETETAVFPIKAELVRDFPGTITGFIKLTQPRPALNDRL
jgi:hypothetical protein